MIAIEDGCILGNYPFHRALSGQISWCGLIAHAGSTATYGEGEVANIADTAQLHFEIYDPNITHNISWPNGEPQPFGVRDPTQFLIDLAAHGRRMTIDQLPLRPAPARPSTNPPR